MTGASLRGGDPIQLSNRNFKRVSSTDPKSVPEVCVFTAATGAYYYIMRIIRPNGILLDDDRTKFPIAECRYILTHIFAAPGGTQFASRTRPAPLAGTFYELKMRMRCLSIYLYTSDNNECVKDR